MLTSYDCSGKLRFAKLLESKSDNFCYGLAYNAGSIYVVGNLYNINKHIGFDTLINIQFSYSFLAKFDTLGQYKWIRFPGPNTINTIASQGAAALSIDRNGNAHHYIYLLSGAIIGTQTLSQTGNYDLNYDVNGNLISVSKLQLPDSIYAVKKVESDKTSNSYYAWLELIGSASGRAYDLLCSYSSGGTLLWVDSVDFGGNITSFRYKANGEIFFTGYGIAGGSTYSLGGVSVTNPFSPTNAYTVVGKIAANGKTNWIKVMGGSNAIVTLFDVDVLPDASLACIGLIVGKHKYGADSLVSTSSEGQNPEFFNIDTTGMVLDWNEIHGDAFYDEAYCMTSDKAGSVYIGGMVGGRIYGGKLPQYVSHGGNSDFFVTKYGYDCDCQTMASPTASFTTAITDSVNRKVKFTYTGTNPKDSVIWTLGDGTIMKGDTFTHQFNKADTYTVTVKTYVHCGRKKIQKDVIVPYVEPKGIVNVLLGGNEIKVYPNPANNILHIDGMESGTSIWIHDITGRVIYKGVSYSTAELIDISSFASGNYVVQLTDKHGNRITRKIQKIGN